MQQRRTTFSKFIIENERRRPEPDAELTALLNDIQTACKFIASAVSRGALDAVAPSAHEIMLRECEWGGKLCGIISNETEQPYVIPPDYPRGRYLLAFDALDGSRNLDVDVSVGTIFSVLRAPDGVSSPTTEDFLQPGTRQIAAGFALYGPSSTIVITLGAGVHGFTLDREIGAYTLTHPDMRIPAETNEFAINASNERVWEPPVRHYIEECVAGATGPAPTSRCAGSIRSRRKSIACSCAAACSSIRATPSRPASTAVCVSYTKPLPWRSSWSKPAALRRPGASASSTSFRAVCTRAFP